MEATMIKGPIIVKAKNLQTDQTLYLELEFQLTENQKSELVAELLVAHIKNNTLKVIHEGQISEAERKVKALKEIMEEYPIMSLEMKKRYLGIIADLAEEIKNPID